MKVKDLREVLNDPRVSQDAKIRFMARGIDCEIDGWEFRGESLLLFETNYEGRREAEQDKRSYPGSPATGPTGRQVAQKVKDILTMMNGKPETTVLNRIAGFIDGILLK